METKYYMIPQSIAVLYKITDNGGEIYFWNRHQYTWHHCTRLPTYNKKQITEEEAFRYILEH